MMKNVQNNYKGKNSSKIKRNIPKRTIALQLIFCVKTWAVNRVTQCLKKAPFSFPAGVQLVYFGDENGYLSECMLCYANYRYYRTGGLLDTTRNHDNWEK